VIEGVWVTDVLVEVAVGAVVKDAVGA